MYVQVCTGPQKLNVGCADLSVVCEGSIIVRRRALSNGAPQVWTCVLLSLFVFFLLLLFVSSLLPPPDSPFLTADALLLSHSALCALRRILHPAWSGAWIAR